MGFSEAISTVLGKYADFTGRARRSEYWFWALALGIVYLVFVILASIADAFWVIGLLVDLALLVPTLAVGVRRLHDTDRSGWWLLIGLVPFVGSIVLLVFFVMEGTPGDNRYGPNPKGLGGSATPMGYGPPPTV
jgi:uncharacterized membrane protein YhaH (DUF805 family)